MTAPAHEAPVRQTSPNRSMPIPFLAITAAVAGLTALAFEWMSWTCPPMPHNTATEIRALDAHLQQHWNAVIADAQKERLWTADESNLLTFADNDPERARIMQIKIRLMEAFPVNFDEIPSSGDCYLTAPYDLIPRDKRRCRESYQASIFDPDTRKPRWQTADQTGKESVESAVCLWLVLTMERRGIVNNIDLLRPFLRDTDDTGNPVLADGWGTPLRFYRFATGNADLQRVAPPALVVPGALDPLDPNGKLLNWGIGANAVNFDNAIHVRTAIDAAGAMVAQYAVPVIVSAGPDGKFGLPAVDGKTKTGINAGGIPTIAGAAPYQSMQVPAIDANSVLYEKDNIYSFKKAS
jgi:hypothetical protein